MDLDKKLVIAIDGPAGAGKSTIARIIAQRLGYIYIDTGAMYRALTLKALRENIDLGSEEELARLANNTEIKFKKDGEKNITLLDGEDVTEAIRTNQVSNNVSLVAKVAQVRSKLVELQQKMAEQGATVMDGRDIGIVVLPEADLKVFLTATVEERTKRRYEDLEKQGEEVKFEELKQEIIRRDQIDQSREVSPLKKAQDAIEIDSTQLSIDQVVDRILDLCQEV